MASQSSRRLRALAVVAAGSLVALSATTAVAAAGNPATTGSGTSTSTTEYAIGVPECTAPAPGDAQCFAMRRVVVSKGTFGARAFHPLASSAAASSNGVTRGPGGGYTPADLASAYGINPASGGTGQTVALVDAFNDPNITLNLNSFDSHYGLPAETASSFRVVGQTGTSTLPANDTTGWSTEESLDVDTVRGLCHHCKIILVEANSQSQTDLGLSVNEAVKLGATEISNSYGYPEQNDPSQPTDPNEIADYTHPGVVMTVSTGDDGWYDYDFIDAINSPDQPSTLPGVIGVGGTTLNLTPAGRRASETVWNDNGPYDVNEQGFGAALGATGGGCSTLYTAPAWQHHVAGYGSLGCATMRSPADISADADYLTGYDIYDTFADHAGDGGGWETIGGTSLASPIIAAMWALAGGAHGMAHPAATLYGHSGAHSPFYDVTVGGNSWCEAQAVCQLGGSTLNSNGAAGLVDCATNAAGVSLSDTGQCDAEPGYDGPTGLGAPNGLSEFRPATPTARISAPAHVLTRKTAKFSGAKSSDPYPGGEITKYTWSWGDGSKPSTGAKASHRFTKAGKHTVRLTVSDSYGQTGTTTTKVTVKNKKKKK
ncbi:MAG TPA: PKD domain-containing protein [Mycobacteriales bacterium]|nr:PKD domain-containing protein [Mycobacteriales bacterium]